MCLFSEIGGDRVTGTHDYIYIIRRDSILDVGVKKVGLNFTYTFRLMSKFKFCL